jgi:hypothetical protein
MMAIFSFFSPIASRSASEALTTPARLKCCAIEWRGFGYRAGLHDHQLVEDPGLIRWLQPTKRGDVADKIVSNLEVPISSVLTTMTVTL